MIYCLVFVSEAHLLLSNVVDSLYFERLERIWVFQRFKFLLSWGTQYGAALAQIISFPSSLDVIK